MRKLVHSDKNTLALALVLGLGLVFGAGRLQAQDAAAMIVRVSGAVSVVSGGANPVAAAAGTRLAIGDRVLPDGGQALIAFASGSTQRVTEALTIEPVQTAGAAGGQFSRTLGVMANAATSDARSRPNRQGMIRPVPGEPVLASPRNGLLVMSTRPTFTWHAVPGASGYTVQIRRDGGAFIRLESEDTTFTLPPHAPALIPGERYLWTVAPSGAGRPTREQSFVVLGAEGYGQVQKDLELLAENDLDPFTDGLLFAATVYREAGLLYEASAALGFLEESGSPLSADVWLLRGEIYDAMGRLEDARMAFDKVDELIR